MQKTLLLVDDDPMIQECVQANLNPHYQVRVAGNGIEGLRGVRAFPKPDLILLDIELPDMTGYDICAALKQDLLTASIPVIFLSGRTDVDDVTHGFELGAEDYITKPVAPPILLARVQTHLRLREATELLRDQNSHLELQIKRRTLDLEARTLELQRSQELSIVALGSIAETRDNETGNHIYRTSAYVEVLAKRLARHPVYRAAGTRRDWEMIWKSAPLHDIGKVGIPDHILLKPGPLTEEEFEVMKRHTVLGRDAIRSAEIRVRSEGSFLRVASEIAYSHHERWDGKGYPQGIGREDIPLSARIMALADVYDALTSKRVYKDAISHDAAIEIILAGRGSQFDPLIVDCFMEDADEFLVIASRFNDGDVRLGPVEQHKFG